MKRAKLQSFPGGAGYTERALAASLGYSEQAIEEALADRKPQKVAAKKLRKTQSDPGRIYAVRIECDPKGSTFRYAFVVLVFDGFMVRHFWGRNCLREAKQFLESCEPGLIYFHRGDQRDFRIVFDWFQGRIVLNRDQAIYGGEMFAHQGTHRIADATVLFDAELKHYRGRRPAPPAIEPEQLRRDSRDAHRMSILARMTWEAGAIWDTITEFRKEYGSHLTLGSAAIAQLNERHYYARLDRNEDREIRELFYRGGRCEAFEGVGVFTGDFKLYDVNSMYPYVMRSYLHPIGFQGIETKEVIPATCFLIVQGRSRGQLLWEDHVTGSHFTSPHEGYFAMTIHEWKMSHRLKLWDGEPEVFKVYNYPDQGTFGEFVDEFYERRLAAIRRGDHLRADFANNILRAASGKLAQNPNRYFEHRIEPIATVLTLPGDVRNCADCADECCTVHWRRLMEFPEWNKAIWQRLQASDYVLNVATAASITGAARAIVMRAIAGSIRPLYTDTDSLICEGIRELLHVSDLGAWKCEVRAHTVAIAGLKRYAMFGDRCPDCKRAQDEKGTCENVHFHKWGCVKLACAGLIDRDIYDDLPEAILAMARGERAYDDLPLELAHSIQQLRSGELVQRYTIDDSGELAIETGLREDQGSSGYQGEW